MDQTPSISLWIPRRRINSEKAAQASTSFGGARPKVRSRKKSKKESDKCDSITGTIERAVNILESTTCRRREEFRERKRLKKMEQNVTRYLGPGWVDTLIQDEPWIPAEGRITDSLRKLARSILISGMNTQLPEVSVYVCDPMRRSERKEDLKPWIPLSYRLAKSRIPCPLSDEPVECDFDDDFEIELDTDPDLPLQIKLPGLSKKIPNLLKNRKRMTMSFLPMLLLGEDMSLLGEDMSLLGEDMSLLGRTSKRPIRS
ncbi:uncharacterized protein TNIN_223761 [Trichonephila inaurata madagascariensis]|uniref:Uncharacterized protein n=1 Tax=Trichonephila inaurata madagascariensis TaxID=2747483 RepID=A0A8X6YXE8_9ARAC|nr:uncharacterized protein TNIN_223761 [Trichonephila inaurata madagascariensis]